MDLSANKEAFKTISYSPPRMIMLNSATVML